MKKSILKTTGIIAVLALIAGDKIGNDEVALQTAKYQEPRMQTMIVIEEEQVPLTANPFSGEDDTPSVSDNSSADDLADRAER